MSENENTNKESSGKSRKWIAVVMALMAIIGTGAFAVAEINDPNTRTPLLVGDSINSSGEVTATNTFQWTDDCAITTPGVFTEILAECTQHTVVIRVTADKGDRGTFVIEDLLCFADEDDTAARLTGEVDSGLLLDIIETADVTFVRITTKPNEWIVNVENCDGTVGDENRVEFDLVVLDEGDFRFSVSIEPL